MEQNRQEQFFNLFPNEPEWRWRQIEAALFKLNFTGWADMLTLSKAMRQVLADQIPWLTIAPATILISQNQSTRKALLKLIDGEHIETVLMPNRRGQYSVCVSSQVGCAMRCSFCATGRMELKRNLTADEISDQLRFWLYYLRDEKMSERISNIVMMGMGEPLANYENVKIALGQWLKYTDIGGNHITVSTVGLLPNLQKLLADKSWPPVRLAISLHAADENLRRKIVPSTSAGFLAALADWCKSYLAQKGSNQRHLTFEYVLLSGINDSGRDAKLLAGFVTKIGRVKVNLIPYNKIGAPALSASAKAKTFAGVLEKCGVTVTIRKSEGADIMAACGQLAGKIMPNFI